jgi:alpha-tubulin suppressor-like RCC1 family protein
MADSDVDAPIKQNITGVKAIACGVNHTLALKEDGTVWVWEKYKRCIWY